MLRSRTASLRPVGYSSILLVTFSSDVTACLDSLSGVEGASLSAAGVDGGDRSFVCSDMISVFANLPKLSTNCQKRSTDTSAPQDQKSSACFLIVAEPNKFDELLGDNQGTANISMLRSTKTYPAEDTLRKKTFLVLNEQEPENFECRR